MKLITRKRKGIKKLNELCQDWTFRTGIFIYSTGISNAATYAANKISTQDI